MLNPTFNAQPNAIDGAVSAASEASSASAASAALAAEPNTPHYRAVNGSEPLSIYPWQKSLCVLPSKSRWKLMTLVCTTSSKGRIGWL